MKSYLKEHREAPGCRTMSRLEDIRGSELRVEGCARAEHFVVRRYIMGNGEITGFMLSNEMPQCTGWAKVT